jgi:hypothetical protein
LLLAAALSLLLALGLGAGAALLLHHYRAGQESAEAGAAEQAPDEVFDSLQKREEFLKQAVEHYANPDKDQAKVRLGLGSCIELGLFYLDQWRLDEADQLFCRFAGNQDVKPYHSLGLLGHAIVLGLENQAEKSNKAFLEVLSGGQAAEKQQAMLIRQNARLRAWVARALDYNAANLPAGQLPPALDHLRDPGGRAPADARAGNDKPPGKKP